MIPGDEQKSRPSTGGFWRSVGEHVKDELKYAGLAFTIGAVAGGAFLGMIGLKHFGVEGMLIGALAGIIIGGLALLIAYWLSGGLFS